MAEYAKIEFVPKVHSEWGASGYYRWSAARGRCPGSVRLIREKAPPELPIDDEVTDDGIEAHGLAEALLKERDLSLRAVLKAKMQNNGADPGMLLAVHKYVNYVEELATLPGAELLVEQSFNLSWLADGLFGTTDATVYAPFSDYYDLDTQTLHKGPTLHVIDLKYGFKEVEAEENVQALYYALGAYAHYRGLGKEVNRVVVHIWQPRVPGRRNASLRWSCDTAYLERFAVTLKDDKLATEEPDAKLNPGTEWCRLCKARTVCPELLKPAWHAARRQLIETGHDPKKAMPTFEQAKDDPATLWMVAGLAKQWAQGLLDRTRGEMQRGEKKEGLKLVDGRGARVIANPSKVMEAYPREEWPELYEEPELKSAAQIVEALSKIVNEGELKKFEKDFVTKLPGAPLVALESDKRKEFSTFEKAKGEWAEDLHKPGAPPPPPPPAVTYDATPDFLKGVTVVPAAPPAPPPAPPAIAYDPTAFFNNTKQG